MCIPTSIRSALFAVFVLCIIFVCGCTQSTLTPSEATVAVGEIVPFEATATDPDDSVSWSIEDGTVASVDGSGNVTGEMDGETRVVAMAIIEDLDDILLYANAENAISTSGKVTLVMPQ
jgi:uncharacterized protein YjdB